MWQFSFYLYLSYGPFTQQGPRKLAWHWLSLQAACKHPKLSRWAFKKSSFNRSCGSSGMITCVLRFVVFYKTDILSDPTWFSIEMTIWTTTESGLYLIAACLPSFRSLVPLIMKKEYFSIFRNKLSGYHSKLFSRQTSHADNTEEIKGREPSEKTSPATRISSHLRFGKWTRFEQPVSFGDDHVLEGLTACSRENSSRTMNTGNSDFDMEKGLPDQGIRIQRGYCISMDR